MDGPARVAVVGRLRQRLLAESRPGGGWGYYPGKSSRVEPTCWALLALQGSADDPSAFSASAAPHASFLIACQRDDGLLREEPGFPNNFTDNGLAALTFNRLPALAPMPMHERLIAGIVAVKGVALAQGADRQDNSLQAWPWIPDTFSWAEPTAWCTLALKTVGPQSHGPALAARVAEAEKLLVNRSCVQGGWNYGNGSALGQDLRAHVPTTAIGLLAMQDRPADPVVVSALRFLEDSRLKEASALTLGLTAIALRIHGRPLADVEDRLVAVLDRAERLGNLQALAVALFALTADRHEARALRV